MAMFTRAYCAQLLILLVVLGKHLGHDPSLSTLRSQDAVEMQYVCPFGLKSLSKGRQCQGSAWHVQLCRNAPYSGYCTRT